MDKIIDWPEGDVFHEVPLLLLRSTVLFPLQVASVQIATKANLRLLEDHADPRAIVGAGVLVDPDGPANRRNLGPIAVACRILNRIDMGGGSAQVVLQGLRRIRIREVVRSRPYLRTRAEGLDESEGDRPVGRERVTRVVRLVRTLVETDDRYPDELAKVVEMNHENGSRCADLVADLIQFGYVEKRQLLETEDVSVRLDRLAELVQREIARSKVAREVQTKTAISIDRTRRESLLREQLEIIRRELEELDPAEAEIAELARKTEAAPLPPIVAEEARREVQRLRHGPTRHHEGFSIRAYVDWVLSMPWEATTKDRLDLRRARRMVDKRYLGLGTARDRLLEFLAVRKLGGNARLPLLVILGPSGTGRTSLASTVAEVLGRRFVRIPMQGIHDAAEIRGHRRTAAAARPGRVLDGLRTAGVRNPVILIDHLDRLEARIGEPMHSLVDALHPERNGQFLDHYLGVPFDLSEVLFVVTANVEEEIPRDLWSFMHTIEMPGYTEPVKRAIVRESLWPELVEGHGISRFDVRLTNTAVTRIIRHYTREAGVRELRLHLRTICRRIAVQVAVRGGRRLSIGVRNLEEYLGKPLYVEDPTAREPKVGAATGLAWTEAGGVLLPIEALIMPGEGYVMVTGMLGEVMEESVEAALSYVRSRGAELKIPADTLYERDLHIHFPEGAIPKDGPSAGIAAATTIASLLSGRPVRHDIAMTGEISLQGWVLPVGGIREKVLAAYRAGIKRVILPKGNESDLDDVPRDVRGKMRFDLVGDVGEVFGIALKKKPVSRPGK
jgi:ATP-dependent Lon protease